MNLLISAKLQLKMERTIALIRNRIIEEGVEQDVHNLMEDIPVEKEIHENFVFQDFETDKDLFWTLLAYNGYLTFAGKGDFDTYKLKIPNSEVKTVFRDIVKTWMRNEVKLKREILVLTIKHLINNNITEFEKGFKRIIGDTFSYFDTAANPKNPDNLTKNEQVYHVYTLGLLAILSDDYIIKSNRESGEGRYDIMLIPYDKSRYGIVIEFKSIESQKEKETNENFVTRVNSTINKALQQIETKKYYKELINNGINPEKIIKLSIVFASKEPFVKKLEN